MTLAFAVNLCKIHWRLCAHIRSHLVAISYAVALATGSYLVWRDSVDGQRTPLGAGMRLAALALVVMWSHFLVWLFRKMLRQEFPLPTASFFSLAHGLRFS